MPLRPFSGFFLIGRGMWIKRGYEFVGWLVIGAENENDANASNSSLVFSFLSTCEIIARIFRDIRVDCFAFLSRRLTRNTSIPRKYTREENEF